MKRLMAGVVVASLMVVAGAVLQSSQSPAPPPFRAGLEAHLAALESRNMDALLPTLTSGNDLTMIAPNGFKWDTRQQYVEFHRTWFASKDDGKLEPEIVRLIESPALSHALLRSRYTSKDDTGKTRTGVTWLTLTFALENNSWRLVFDQNTPIDPKPAK